MKQIRNSIITLSLFSLVLAGCQKNCLPMTPVVVDAGNSQTIQLPDDSLTLTGIVKSGLTPGMTYLWTLISGPNVPVFGHNDSTITIVTGLDTGTYVLQFQATNNAGSTGLDTTSIIVKPAVVKTVTLQPSNYNGEIVMTELNNVDQRAGWSPESFLVSAWTSGGQSYNSHMAVRYDLSGIPAGATILTANFYLYSNPTPDNGNQVDANFGADNSFVLQQITAPWDSTTVTYYHPPSVTTANQVQIPSTTSSFLDVNLDVKDIVVSMLTSNANYGFFLKLNNEVIYTDRCFVSSYNSFYPDKHPKLVITYK